MGNVSPVPGMPEDEFRGELQVTIDYLRERLEEPALGDRARQEAIARELADWAGSLKYVLEGLAFAPPAKGQGEAGR